MSSDNASKSSGLKAPSKIVRPTIIPKQPTTAPVNVAEPSFKVGDRVIVNGSKSGTVAFIGEAKFKEGEWAGVILDTLEGKNNGTVDGVQYFQTDENRGIFCRLNKLTADTASSTQAPVTAPTETLESNSEGSSLYKIGERVVLNSSSGPKKGYLRFLGEAEFAKGEWAGLELDERFGKNDGSVNGKRYFQCEPLHGVFAPLHKIERLTPESEKVTKQQSALVRPSLLKPKLTTTTTLGSNKKNLLGSQESINSMRSEQSNISMSASQKSGVLKRPSTVTKSKLATSQVVSVKICVRVCLHEFPLLLFVCFIAA